MASVRRTHLGMRAPARTVSHNAATCESSRATRVPQRAVSASEAPRRAESSLRVLLRVRGTAAPGESVLATEGTRGKNIHVLGDTLLSARGASRPRTYDYDCVLSAEADQNMVYAEAMQGVLEDLLLGYNCTVFAYGLTGTGKTHTMEGDLSDYMETFAPNAGVIPRTLYRLFHVLETRGDDFAIRVSLVELYNEEIRDLLSDDASSPPLRMYDDVRGRGVVLQGLEEIPLTSAAHGLRLLREGSQRRHVAATKCNQRSSRSHCVFTLTVHVKEAGARGEELMRTGKLHLVDLAGSESIGRSGAEHQRAREAGQINQSLLTLGRVIHALVDGSTHVPYRESRLTRLLQDSLGGRAKTCMIATVSDDPSSLEETLSTLDYAYRARSIKNRPEANQRMTRAALLKEYVGEIDRLRSDLTATRTQTGIYVSEENWARREAEHTALTQQLDELRRANEVVTSQLASLQEQLEQNTRVLAKREADAARAEAEQAARVLELEHALHHAASLSRTLQEETRLHHAHAASERKLDQVAHELRQLAEQATDDVHGLFAKLERRAKADAQARQALTALSAELRDTQQRVAASAAVPVPQALTHLVDRVSRELWALQQVFDERIASAAAQLGNAGTAALRDEMAQAMHAHHQHLIRAHTEACAAWQATQDAHVGEVAALLTASERMTHCVDTHLATLHGQAGTLLSHASSSAARVHAQSHAHAEAWAQHQQRFERDAEAMRASVLAALDAFVQQQAQHLDSQKSAAESTSGASLQAEAQTLCASHRAAWDAAHSELSSVSNELTDACIALHASADGLGTHVDAQRARGMHELDAAAAQWQAATDHVWERHTSAEVVAQAAADAAEEVRATLGALDVRAEAADALHGAQRVQAATSEAAARLSALDDLLGPLAAPPTDVTGETPRRRTWSMPVWDVVPQNRHEALAWWDAAGERSPLRAQRHDAQNRPCTVTPHK